MSDYKRLVSYIYSYPGGVRDRNVGFAKAEVRNGQLKLVVSLKGVYTDTPETFGVYFLVDKDEEVAGRFTLLKLGNVIVNAGIGKYTDILNPENLNNSMYKFADISGIAVANPDNRYYMMFSMWEDAPVNPDTLNFTEEMPHKSYEQTAVNREAGGDNVQVANKNEEALDESVPDKTESDKTAPDKLAAKKPAEDNNVVLTKQKVQEESRHSEVVAAQINAEPDGESIIKNDEPVKAQSVEENGSKQIEAQVQRDFPEKQSSEDIQNVIPNVRDEVTKDDKVTENDGFDKIFDKADQVDAFDDDYFYNCIEVTPDMLKSLPLENRNIVSNSFLMHGYYNFKHLLFGRVRDNDNNTKYFLGVPGMYCNRERFMASMFGFNNFKKSHRSDYTNPYFGYWYQEI